MAKQRTTWQKIWPLAVIALSVSLGSLESVAGQVAHGLIRTVWMTLGAFPSLIPPAWHTLHENNCWCLHLCEDLLQILESCLPTILSLTGV
jgi:hypothetical protein